MTIDELAKDVVNGKIYGPHLSKQVAEAYLIERRKNKVAEEALKHISFDVLFSADEAKSALAAMKAIGEWKE